ncbi:MAG: hypothetical protein JXR44_08135 [Thiotrichales bacterium]|nr:hypothetical protein [Thiotrichales bacterium]
MSIPLVLSASIAFWIVPMAWAQQTVILPSDADRIVLERDAQGRLQLLNDEQSRVVQPSVLPEKVETPKALSKLSGQEALSKPLNLQTILLDKPTREKIDRQRAEYINPPITQAVEKVVPPPVPTKTGTGTGTAGPARSVAPKIILPGQLRVEAIVVKPNGEILTRINGRYNQTTSPHITINREHSSAAGLALEVLGKEQTVPVGNTLLPKMMQVLPTYQYQQKQQVQAKQRALPITQERVAQETLEQVKILNPKPEPNRVP